MAQLNVPSAAVEQLLLAAADRDFEAFDRSIDVHVSSLRKKLVQQLDYDLQARGVRPSVMHTRANTCWHPWVRGLALAANSQYNHWRLEDVWLNK